MPKYEALPVIKIELMQLDYLIDKYGSNADLGQLKRSRSDLEKEYRQLIRELKLIKADDSEVYRMIYYHDIERKDWFTVCELVCPEEFHPDPGGYCRKKITKYLKRHNLE